MARMTKTIHGVTWQVSALGSEKVIFSAEMSDADVEAHGEFFAAARAKGWELEIVTHEEDADIAEPGRPFVILRAPESALAA